MWLVRKEDLPTSVKAEVILDTMFRDIPVLLSAEAHCVPVQTIKNIIYEYKSLRGRKLKKLRRRQSRKSKLSEFQLEWLRDFINSSMKTK